MTAGLDLAESVVKPTAQIRRMLGYVVRYETKHHAHRRFCPRT